MPPKVNIQPAKSAARNQTKKNNEETKNKNRDARKKRSSHKAVESVLRPEGSLWWERFVKKVGLEPGVKVRGSYGW